MGNSHDNNGIESATDPRRISKSHDPSIAEIDSLETYSDDFCLFDFVELDRVKVQEETIDNIADTIE